MKYLYLLFGTIVGGLTVYYALNNYNLRKADMIVTPVTTLHGDVKPSHPSVLISNRDLSMIKDEVTKTPYPTPVYNLAFIAYSKQFAEQFAAKDEYVTSMDKGLHYMEVKMITEGQKTVCYYTVVLDKDIKLALPKEEYMHQSITTNFYYPSQKDWTKKQKWDKFHLRTGKNLQFDSRFFNKTYLGNPDYQFNTSGDPFSDGIAFGIFVIYYYPNRAGYQLISTKEPCGGGKLFNFPNPSFWVQKDGANERSTLPQKHNYHMFAIPQTIIDRFQPYLYEFEKNKIHNMQQGK